MAGTFFVDAAPDVGRNSWMRTSRTGLPRLLPVALLALAACTTNRRTDMDASSADVALDTAAVDVGDNDATGTNCQAIRFCIFGGQSLDVCVARGTLAAQDTFNKLLTCLRRQPMPACTGTDTSCTCPEECYADGLCLDETAACLDSSGATADGVCEQYCGG